MRYFQGNPNLYKPFIESYTAADEFHANKRVHINNEIPPEDLFDKVHSTMKNEFWQWFLGNTYLTYDMEYNVQVDNEEIWDKDGTIAIPGIAKYVNGIRAKDYGPLPKLVWSTKDQDYVIEDAPLYHRLEVNGTIMPEFDFLLHEGYRYLSVLYPDHPDFMELLTLNEFNDEIQQSGAIIDYRINCKFMDWLSEYLQYPDDDILIEAQMQEASMLKIRNLLNHAFRRKFFGAKVGYNMIGADVYQHVSVFPVAEYLPIKNYTKSENYIAPAKDFKWKKAFENRPQQFEDWMVNKFDKIYKRLFRLVDWTNESYDYLNRWDPPIPYYGTAYPTPTSTFDLYEYPLERDVDIEGDENFMTDFSAGQKVWLNGQNSGWDKKTTTTGNISYINKEPAYKVGVNLSYVEGELDLNTSSLKISRDADVVHIKMDVPSSPNYTDFTIVPSNEKTLSAIIEYNQTLTNILSEDGTLSKAYINLEEYDEFVDSIDSNHLYQSTKKLWDMVYADIDGKANDNRSKIKLDPKYGKFTLDPHQNGTLYAQPAQFLTLYQDELNYSIENGELTFADTVMKEDGFVQRGDILVNKWTDNSHLAEVVGMTKGYIQFRIDSAEKMTARDIEALITNVNKEIVPTKGLVFSLYDGPNKGKKIVLFGRPIVSATTEPDANNMYQTLSVYFNIAAIPRVKSLALCRALYSEFDNYANDKYNSLYTIFGKDNQFEDTDQFVITKNIDDSLNLCYSTATGQLAKMIALSSAGKSELHSNDINWQELIKTLDQIKDVFESSGRPALFEQISQIIETFLENAHKEVVFDKTPEVFERLCAQLLEDIKKYCVELITWSKGQLLVDLNREYYTKYMDLQNEVYDIRRAWSEIESIDKLLDNVWLPNRSMLFTPYPIEDPYLNSDSSLDMEVSYSLKENLDNFESLFYSSINEYGDLIEYHIENKWGTSGKLTNVLSIENPSFDFGTINIASTVESHFSDEIGDWATCDILDDSSNVDRIDDYFISSSIVSGQINVGPNYIVEYSIEDDTQFPIVGEDDVVTHIPSGPHKYYSLNKDIVSVIDASSDLRRFAYADPNFLELFLPDDKKLNIMGQIDTKTKVKIRSYTTLNSNIIEIRDEASLNRLGCLTSGDQVIGKTIENDTFIEDVDIEKGLITVNKNLSVTGSFVLTYLCQINTFPEDTNEDFFKYREELSKNGQANDGSIFNHGVYGSTEYPYLSNSFLKPPLDVSNFRDNLLHNLQDQPIYRDYFNKMIDQIHNEGKTNTFKVPSTYNVSGDLFFEVNAYQTFDFKSWERDANNTLDNTGYLMKKEVLDYFEQMIPEISRASDSVNVGVNISAYTFADGKVSRDSNEEYSDPNIKMKFVTTPYWTADTLPIYIDVGIGRLDHMFDKDDGEQIIDDSIKNQGHLYDWDTYGEAMYKYRTPDDEIVEEEEIAHSIDKPIMRLYLGEYEVQKSIQFENYFSDRTFTTVQFSVIKQVFENLEKNNEVKLNVVSSSFFSNDILKTWPNNYKIAEFVDGAGVKNVVNIVPVDGKNTFNPGKYVFLGEWSPTVEFDKEKNLSTIVFPDIPPETVSRSYYTIGTDTKLSNVASKYDGYVVKDYEYKMGDILMFINNEWRLMSFNFAGYYGEAASLKTNWDTEEYEKINNMAPNITLSYSTYPTNGDTTTEDNSLKHRLVTKVVGLLSGKSVIDQDYKKTVTIWDILYNGLTEENCTEWYNNNNRSYTLDYLISTIQEQNWTAKVDTNASIFWFLFSGGNGDGWKIFDNINFGKGQIIALIWDETTGSFDIASMNDNVFLYKIDSSDTLLSSTNTLKDEYNTFLGLHGTCRVSPSLSLVERIETVSNNIDLSYKNLLNGSVAVKFKVDPDYYSEGWRYRDDGTLNTSSDPVVEFKLTEDSIYYDEDNNYLYTFNNDKKDKYALKLEDNKFFKNILFLNAAYKKVTSSKGGSLIENGVLSPITGIQFDADQASVFDKVLEIEQINVRSLHKQALEPTLFSSYCNLTGELKGFAPNGQLAMGYTFDTEPKLTSNKLKFSTELKKILPVTDTETYRQEVINYGESEFAGNVLTEPSIMSMSVLQDVSKNPDAALIKYYKNTLVLEGMIDIANPSVIDFGSNTKLADALNYVAANDKIVSIVGLSSSKKSSYKDYSLYYNDILLESAKLRFVDYRNSVFIAVTDGTIYIRQLESLLALPDGKIVFEDKLQVAENGIVNSLSWDLDESCWYFSVISNDLNRTNLGVYYLKYSKIDGVWTIESDRAFNTTGYDVNTYQLIDIVDKDYGDDRFNTRVSDTPNARVLARDVSFTHISDISGTDSVEDLGQTDLWTVETQVDGEGNATTSIASIGPSAFNGSGIQMSTTTGFDPADDFVSKFDNGNRDGRARVEIALNGKDYRILEIDFAKSESSAEGYSLSLGCWDNVKQVWTYDNANDKWTLSDIPDIFFNSVERFSSTEKAHARIYICSNSFSQGMEHNLGVHTSDHSKSIGEFLWKLPRAEVSNNEYTMAYVLNSDTTKLIATINKETASTTGTGKFDLTNIVLKDYPVIGPDALCLEGPYESDDRFISNREDKNKSRRWLVSNRSGYHAMIAGSTLFIKSPTKTYEVKENETTKLIVASELGTTQAFHWKKAELPAIRNLNYELFNEKTLEEAWDTVNIQYQLMLDVMDTRWPDGENMPEPLITQQTWMINNPPIKYTVEGDLPVEIKHNGISISETSNGRVVDFNQNKFYKWSSAQDVYFEAGISSSVYLTRQNYMRYLSDYFEIILGCNRLVPFYKEGIEDVKLTETALVIQTVTGDLVTLPLDKTYSRDDIENYNNWNVSNIDETYVYTSWDVESEKDKVIGVNGKYYSVGEYPGQTLTKTFNIVDTYFGNGLQVLAGYTLATEDMVKQLQKSKLGEEQFNSFKELYPNDGANLFPLKYPAIYASRDEGKTFEKIDISPSGSVKNIGEYISSDQIHIDASSIVVYGNEMRIFLRCENGMTKTFETVGYLSFVFEETGGGTNVEYSSLINSFEDLEGNDPNTVTKKVARSWKSFVIDGTVYGLLPASSLPNVDSDLEVGNSFALNLPFTFNVGDSVITNVTQTTVTYSPSVTASTESDMVRVLVAIDTKKLLQYQSTYIDYKTEYLNTVGDFKVPLFTTVSDKLLANRMFSPREVMTISERNIGQILGVPAIAEDLGHSVYEYLEPYKKSTGEEVWEYKQLRNQDDQKVALCYANGDFVTSLNTESSDVVFTLKDIIDNGIDYEDLIAAPILLDSFEAVMKEQDLEDVFNRTILKKVNKLNISGSNPQLLFSDPTMWTDILGYFDDNNYLYKWPVNDDNVPLEWTDEMEQSVLDGDRNVEGLSDIIDCKYFIEETESEFNSVNNRITERLTYQLIGENYYVKDCKWDLVLLKKFFKIELNCSIPYKFSNGQQSYKGMPLIWDENDNIKSYTDGYELNCIYLPPKGYGGYISNTDWNKQAPHEIDYIAFGDKLVTNKYGENVYLCDAIGNVISVKNGLFFQTAVQQSTISWDNIANDKQTVSISEEYGYNTTDFYLYKREVGEMTIFTPKEYVYFNTVNNDKVLQDKKLLLTYLTLTKSGKEVHFENNADFEKEYTVQLLDYEGKPLVLRADSTIDVECTGLSLQYDNSSRGLYLNLDDVVTEYIVPYVWGNKVTIQITDNITGRTCSKELRVDDTHNAIGTNKYETYKVVGMRNIDGSYTGKNFNNERTIDSDVTLYIDFDPDTITEYSLSPLDKSIVITRQPTGDLPTATVLVNELPKDNKISIDSEILSLDLRHWNLEVLIDRDWADEGEYPLDTLKLNIYSGDQLYKTESDLVIETTEKSDKWTLKIEEGLTVFEIDIVKSTIDKIAGIQFDEYIFTQRTEPIKFKMGHDKMLVSGIFGNVLFVRPKYNSFKDLLNAHGQIIEYKNRRIIAKWTFGDTLPINEIESVDQSFKSITLAKTVDYGDLNDGNEHYLRIKLLPLNTIYPKTQFANHPDYIYEIPYNETSVYGFDRVWINDRSYPKAPMQYNGIFYNEENSPYYNLDTWKNKDGYKVYACDEFGRFVKAVPLSNSLSFVALGDSLGNCSGDIYGNVDPRINVLEPLYNSSIDWYLDSFYIKGQETNPFISYVDIRDEFDNITNKFIQTVSITQPKKVGKNIEYLPIEDSYLTGASKCVGYYVDGDTLVQTTEKNLIDHKNGIMSFFVTGPKEDFMYDDYKFYYGLKYKNSFNIVNGSNSSYWLDGSCKLSNKIVLNFYLNTMQNLIDKENRDFAVVGVTEIGLFDKNNKLVAYATHPKAEYRTDSQHLSYSLIIEEK